LVFAHGWTQAFSTPRSATPLAATERLRITIATEGAREHDRRSKDISRLRKLHRMPTDFFVGGIGAPIENG
jgi:hypothetical protein